MGILALLRRVVLHEHEHEREHEAVNSHLSRADEELTGLAVRVQRLEIERRLRGRGRRDGS